MATGRRTSAEPQFGIVRHFFGEAKGLGLADAAGQDVGELADFKRVVDKDVGNTLGHDASWMSQEECNQRNPSGRTREWAGRTTQAVRCQGATSIPPLTMCPTVYYTTPKLSDVSFIRAPSFPAISCAGLDRLCC